MKYKGKEIKTHLRENVRRMCNLFTLGEDFISEYDLRCKYGYDISGNMLRKKAKDYLVESVLDRYTVTQHAEPGVKVMYCKAHIVDAKDIKMLEDATVFVPIFTRVSIPRHSVIYTSGDSPKRRASAGKITDILHCPTNEFVGCYIVPRKESSFVHYKDLLYVDSESTYIYAVLSSSVMTDDNQAIMTDDNQAIMLIRDRGHFLDAGFNNYISVMVHIEFDDYNPKTRTTDTVYSMHEIEYYLRFKRMITRKYCRDMHYDYTPLARHIGYSVKIDDFDITPCTCSKGFHFFDSIDEANSYISI